MKIYVLQGISEVMFHLPIINIVVYKNYFTIIKDTHDLCFYKDFVIIIDYVGKNSRF